PHLAAARTELAHTKRQLTTTSIKLDQLRAQVAATNKGFSKDQKDKWSLLMRSRVSLPFLRGMLSPATPSSSLARPRNQECDTHTGGYTAEYILSRERLLCLPGVSAEQLGTLCTAVVGAVFLGADPGRQASATTHRRNHDLLQTCIHEAHTVWLRRAFTVHVQLDGCTIHAHGKVVLYRVTAAVRCFSPSPAAAAGSPCLALAAAAGSPNPAPAPLPIARPPKVQEMPSPTPQLEARVVAVRKCPSGGRQAARKTEESACMVDGNAKMVLNVPTQAPLQQLQQAFQQHALGADYNNTSAKEAARFTREQLRAYLLYHKVPPRDQPVGNTLVAGWQKAVQKHIAERVLAMECKDFDLPWGAGMGLCCGKGVLLPHLRWVLAVLLDVCL
ncbi:hypothetical protein QJQ45_021410, partial [Haematococcus lacustris]